MSRLWSSAPSGTDTFSALFVLCLVGGLLSGCYVVQDAVESGVSSAAGAAGEEVGRALGQQLASSADLPTHGTGAWDQFMVSQAQILFNYAFNPGGMWPAQATYEPGEWAQYQSMASSEGGAVMDTLERAFLQRTEDGNEWWRVRGVQGEDRWIYEALIDPGSEEVVRLRAKDPDGNVGEVPVTEETVYQSPRRLTEESVEGATVGTEQIDTPAGTFTTQHVEYTGGAGGDIVWYLSEEVPGHVVRYQLRGSDGGGEEWTSTLMDYGTDATTILDSY